MNQDEDILYYLSECPILSRKQIGRLTKRNNSYLNESLQRMVSTKALYCNERGGIRSLPFLYAAYDIRGREYFIHDSFISEIYTTLKCTGRVWEWNQPRQKFNEEVNQDVTFYWKIPPTPQGDKLKYYLEFETGKNKSSQIRKKFELYTQMRKKEAFRVLFVLRDERIKELSDYIKIAQEYVDSDPEKNYVWKRYMFALYETVIKTPLDPIYEIPFGKPIPLSKDLIK